MQSIHRYPTDDEAKKLIVEIGRRMYQKNFVAANDGNISCKVDDDIIWTTPTGVSKGFMSEDMMVKMRLDGTVLSQGERAFEYTAETLRFTEKVSGAASLSAPIDYSATLQALVLQRAEADCRTGREGEELQGVVSATLLLVESDGSHRAAEVQLPFALPLQNAPQGEKEVSVLVCGMSVRQKREGEAEVEATLKFAVECLAVRTVRFISALEAGEEIKASDSAFSVFLPREGDGLWEIAKTLHKPPEEVTADNPSMTFPVRRGERIIIYRRKF